VRNAAFPACAAWQDANPAGVKNLSPVAIPVFSAESYHEVMALLPAEERDRLPYEQYLINAEAHENELRETGVETHRIAVLPDALLSWCERHGRAVTRESISLFAADLLENQLAAESPPAAISPEIGE
jgi:hypothetical protein